MKNEAAKSDVELFVEAFREPRKHKDAVPWFCASILCGLVAVVLDALYR